MTPSHPSRSADVRATVGLQLQHYRQARQDAALHQRQHLAAQVAQLQGAVTDILADLDARFAANAESQREQLRSAVISVRNDVADLLQTVAIDRHERTAMAQEQRSLALHALRREVADYLYDLSNQRAERAAARSAQPHSRQRAPYHNEAILRSDLLAEYQTDVSLQPVLDDRMSRIGQSGMVAYVQMARVSIVRALEEGAIGETQQHQIATHVEGLISSVRPFLTETMANLAQIMPADRVQMAEVVSGVQRNVSALIHELETTPWPTIPAHRQTFLHLIEDLRHRLVPLRDEIAVAVQSLQGNERTKPVRSRSAEPDDDPRSTHPYRDNLTTIHGIGPALQQRLDRAGIYTYIQLALSNPDELRKTLGEAGRLANVEDWIAQARSLAGMTG